MSDGDSVLTTDKVKLIYSGNARADGRAFNGWIIGNKQAARTLRRRKRLLVKYGTHKAGEPCKKPWKRVRKVTVSVLIEGGPFVHWFRMDKHATVPFSDGTFEDRRVLRKVGDFLIYEPDALHTWKAEGKSVVLTMQLPPEEWYSAAQQGMRKRRTKKRVA